MAFTQMKPGTLLSPTAVVMVTCASEQHKANIITLGWVGTVNSNPPMVSISIRPERLSHEIVTESGEFVVNLVSRELMKATDYCGVKSGREMDKFEACALNPIPVPAMKWTPAIAESPAYLACAVRSVQHLGSHTMFLGEIIDMGVQDSLLEQSGKIDFVKADLVAYCHGEYMGLQKPEGFFGYSVARPEVLKRRLKQE